MNQGYMPMEEKHKTYDIANGRERNNDIISY